MDTIFQESGPRSSLALPPRSVLHGTYEIGRVLGKGGFGITYAAVDQNLQVPVAIKEFLPAQVAGRGTDRSTVEPHSSGDDDNVFEHGLNAFLAEAQTLAQFDHPNIVRVKAFFRENGTGYLVMPFYEGQTLDGYLHAHDGPMPHDEALGMLEPILNGLSAVHAQGILHRDIKPQNVYLTDTGQTVLLDFGAARIAFGEESQSLSAVLTPGYAPFEQYSRKGHQGPWTDVYATAAMLYRMVTGSKPPEATDRIAGEPLPPPHLSNPALPPAFSAAISTALAVQPKDRPQSIDALRTALKGGDPTVMGGGTIIDTGGTIIDTGGTIIDTGGTIVGGTIGVGGGTTGFGGSGTSTPEAGSILVLQAARDVRFRVDGGDIATLRTGESREVPVTPGSHTVEMSFGGVRRSVRTSLAKGETKTVTLDLPDKRSTSRSVKRPDRNEFDRSGGSGALKWVLGLGALLLVLVTVIGIAIASNTPTIEPDDNGGGGAVIPNPPPPDPPDQLDAAIAAAEAAIRAEIAAEGGVQPTSGIEALRFTGIGEPAIRQGQLAPGDGILDGGEFADLYMFQLNSANYIFAELISDDFDAYLILFGPDGQVLIEVDDAAEGDPNAILDFPLPGPGIYSLFVTSFEPGETGSYVLTVTPDIIN